MAEKSAYTLGILFIIAVAVIWTGASVLTQYIYSDLDFRSPFLVTYISTTLFTIYLPLWKLWAYLGWVEDPPWHLIDGKPVGLCSRQNEESEVHGLLKAPRSDAEPRAEVVYTHRNIMMIALIICPLWFLANCSYNYSLLLTSIGSSTIISNLSGSFTLLFSWIAGIEHITVGKLVGLALCLGGVAMVAVQDHDKNAHSFAGDMVALLGALGYGLYTTALKRMVPDDECISMQVVFGYMGLINAVLFSPAVAVVGLLGLGNIAALTGVVFGFVLLGGIFNNVISDYLWARSVVLTSPTVATVGLSITIPFAILCDFIVYGIVPSSLAIGGALLVTLGFVAVNTNIMRVIHQIRDRLLGKGSSNADFRNSGVDDEDIII